MEEITPVQIGVNRYAPEGSGAVYLYQTKTSDPLTLPQLIASVTLRIAATDELRALNEINRLNAQAVWTTALTSIISYLTGTESKWEDNIWDQLPAGYSPKNSAFNQSTATLKNFFTMECGISESSLPAELKDSSTRLDAYAQIKPIAEEAARESQMLQVEMKTAVSRRDVAYSTSSNTMKSLFSSLEYSSASMKG